MQTATIKFQKPKRQQSTCSCSAYSFPHRLHSGKCEGQSCQGESCSFWTTEKDPFGTGDRWHQIGHCSASSCRIH